MKKYLILAICTGMLFLAACEEEEKGPVLRTDQITAPSGLNSSEGSDFTLLQEEEDMVMTTISWSPADYGMDLQVNYALQMDLAGNDFADVSIIKETTQNSADILVGEINSKLYLSLGLSTGQAHDVELRVRAIVHRDVDTLYSDVMILSVTPYEVDYPKLYVPGSYQGWDAANENTAIYSVLDNGVYEGYLYFPDETTELKFLKVPAWEEDNTIGDPDPSGTSGTLQIGSWGGNNIKVSSGPGYFLIGANLNALSYSSLLTHWGLIGSATPGGWDSDQDMTWDDPQQIWTITLDLSAGEMKFRANDEWGLNYGDDDANGTLEKGGANIAVAEAGNYTITLNLQKPPYRYTVVKN